MRAAAAAVAMFLTFAPCIGHAAGPGNAVSVQRVSGKRIALLAQRELSALALPDDQNFVPASGVPDQIVGEGRVELRPQPALGSSYFVNVPVEIDVDGRPQRTVLVGYRAQQYVHTAIAARDIAPGTVLTANDVKIARVPYTGRPPNGVDVLVGRQTTVTVLKGQPLTLDATAVNQIVKAGSTVMLIVRDGGVAVAADAVARTGGGLGEQVFVFNASTRKALSGTVTAPGTVELDISGGTGS